MARARSAVARAAAPVEIDMMSNVVHTRTRVLAGESGQDLIEYALLVGLIAVVVVLAVTTVGTTIRDVFWSVIAAGIGAVS